MKKSILIGALVVLLLAGFTACSNNTPTSPIMGKQVEGVTLVSAPDYIYAGSFDLGGLTYEFEDKIDPAALELEVLFNDGTRTKYKGSELGVEGKTITSKTTPVDVKIGTLTFSVNVPAYEPTGATLVFDEAEQTTITFDATSLSLEGVVLDVEYAGGTKSYDFSTVTGETEITFTAEELEGVLTTLGYEVGDDFDAVEVLDLVWTAEGSRNAELCDNVAGPWTIEIVDKTMKTMTLSSIAQTGEKELFEVGNSTKLNLASIEASVTYSDSKTPVKVVFGAAKGTNAALKNVTDSNIDKASGTNIDYFIVFTNVKTDYALSANESSVSVEAYIVDKEGIKSETKSFTIATIDDYPASATATLKQVKDQSGADVNPTLEWDDEILPSAYTFDIAWASGYGYAGENEKEPTVTGKWVPTITKVKTGTPDSTAFTTGSGTDVDFIYDGFVGTAYPDKEVKATGGEFFVKDANNTPVDPNQ